MLERYEQIESRYHEIQEALSQPEVAADPALSLKLMKERSSLEEQVLAWQAWKQSAAELESVKELENDPELGSEASEEIKRLEQLRIEQLHLLKLLLLPRDEDDNRSVVMEIRAGAGGEESCLFAADLYRMYEHYAARKNFRLEPVSLSESDLGGLREAVFLVTGVGVWSKLKYESGVHRVQRIPVTDASGKKQTSTCTIAVLPEAEDVDLTISPKDIRIDVYRASGHGGQYVNRTDSAVRITHLPSGIMVTCQDQKSQLRNREQAMKVLRSRLLERMRHEADAAYADNRRIQVGTGDRSERIRTYNFHEGRVTDHRIGLTLYKINDIMNGDLDEIIEALSAADQAERLKSLERL